MIEYKEMSVGDIPEVAQMYIETFNAAPWNDKWTMTTAGRRLSQMVNVEDFYGLCAYEDKILCSMILGSREEFYDCVMFNVKEFCVRNNMRGQGIGTKLIGEFERRLKNQGVDEIFLFTSRSDETEGFYNRRGYNSKNKMVMVGKRL